MKKYILSVIVMLASLAVFAQNPIDGVWKGTRETPNGTMEINYTLKAENGKLGGIWKTPRGESPIEDGKIDGKSFSFTVSFGERKISYTGEVVSDTEIVVKNERGETRLKKQ